MEIDAALVRALIAAQLPDWAGLPVRAVVPGGWDNRTFRLGDTLAVRLPSAARYVAQVEKEAVWLPRLAPQLPLAVPEPVAVGRPGCGYPFPWSVRRWIEGEPVGAGTAGDLARLARDLAGFLQALQRIDATGGPAAAAHSFHRGGALAVYDSETREAVARLAGRIDAGAAIGVWETALASAWERAPVWVHGDVAAGNLLVRDGRLAAVIDWGSCAVGDPACDLAIAWTSLAPVRDVLRAALPLDAGTWARGRGWALWKALIVAAGLPGTDPAQAAAAARVIGDVLADRAGQG